MEEFERDEEIEVRDNESCEWVTRSFVLMYEGGVYCEEASDDGGKYLKRWTHVRRCLPFKVGEVIAVADSFSKYFEYRFFRYRHKRGLACSECSSLDSEVEVWEYARKLTKEEKGE
jgi:hypothetical protein